MQSDTSQSVKINRVALFIDTEAMGGAEFLVLALCLELKRSGIEPVLLHFNHQELSKRLKQEGIKSHIVPKHNLYKSIKTLPLFCWHFRRFLNTLELDVLHSHLYGPITAAGLTLWKSDISHIGTMHDSYTIEQRNVRIKLLQLIANMGTQIVTVAKTMECRFRELAHFPESSIKTILNGVEAKSPFSTQARNDFRTSLDLSPAEIVFSCVGRLVPIKRHTLLLQALAELPGKRNYKLLIVGTGPERQRLEEDAARLNLQQHVSFLGFRSDVDHILGASDCFVLASDSEGLSCSISEAMSAGLPVIATNVGGNSELVTNNESGFLVEPDSPRAIAEKMELLAANSALRKRLGQSSKRFANDSLSLQRMCCEYLALYGSMLSSH